MSVNLSDIGILNIKGSDYCCIISLISKKEAIKLLQNADLTEKKSNIMKSGKLWIKKIQNVLEASIKMEKNIKLMILQPKNKDFTNIKNLLQ